MYNVTLAAAAGPEPVMGASEKVDATFHPSPEPNPWTDELPLRRGCTWCTYPAVTWAGNAGGEVWPSCGLHGLPLPAPRLAARGRDAAAKALRNAADDPAALAWPGASAWLDSRALAVERAQ